MLNFLFFLVFIFCFLLLICLPGFFFIRLFLRSNKPSFEYLLAPAVGLGLVILIFVLSSSLYRYDFWLSIFENILLVLFLVYLLYRKNRISFDFNIRGMFTKFSNEMFFFCFAAVVFLVPAFVMTVPFDTDAQGFGFISLAVREGGTVDSLYPFFDDVKYVYSPGYFLITAYFSDMFGGWPLHQVMLLFSALNSIIFIIGAYYFGMKLFDRRFAFFMAFFTLIGTGLLSSFVDSHFTTILGMTFVLFFLSFFFVNLRAPSRYGTLMSAFFLGLACLSHPDSLIILLIALVPFYVVIFFSRESITLRRYATSFFLVPALGILVASPWLLRIAPLIFSKELLGELTAVNFVTHLYYWTNIVFMQGVIVPILACLGVFYAFRKRRYEDVFMIIWVLAVIEFSMIGLVEWIGNILGLALTAHFYPPNIAWAGPIIPFAFLSTLFVTSYKRISRSLVSITKLVAVLSIIGFFAVLACGFFSQDVVQLSKSLPVSIQGAFVTDADVTAMIWLKENSPKDAIVLNYPRNRTLIRFEGDWVPVISERRSIENREQPFFVGFSKYTLANDEFASAFESGDKERIQSLIRENNVSFILVPQLSVNSSAYVSAQSWSKKRLINMSDFFSGSELFMLVFDKDGAQVYEVLSKNLKN